MNNKQTINRHNNLKITEHQQINERQTINRKQ